VHEDENGVPIFIKTLGDQVELWFQLEQDIDCLNGNDTLSISEDGNGFDEAFGISKTNFGRGAMVTQHTDYRNSIGTPQLYTDYLSGITASGADTTVQLFEEGDYEVALNYDVYRFGGRELWVNDCTTEEKIISNIETFFDKLFEKYHVYK